MRVRILNWPKSAIVGIFIQSARNRAGDILFLSVQLFLEAHMKIKILLTSALLVGTALPAFAQSSYFIVQGPNKHCSIVDQRPVTHETTVVGPNGVMYKTRTEAESAMKTVTVCHP
jgi:hypothetical protein